MSHLRLLFLAVAWVLLGAAPAFAHKPSDSYLSLRLQHDRLAGRWDIALRDLDLVLDLDRSEDGRIDWGEVRTRLNEIDRYALDHLRVAAAAPCALDVTDHAIDRHSDGAYVVLTLAGPCAGGESLSIDYSLLFDVDAQHRGLLKLDIAGAADPQVVSAVFPADRRLQSFPRQGMSTGAQLLGYLRDGVVHIAVGYDHLLFLLALLLPAVLVRREGVWVPAPGVAPVAGSVVKTVTAFTLAHSVTLALATLGVVSLPARLTESAIAASVLLTAIDNIVTFLPSRRWIVAFVFGLIHGFGFASVLADLDLPRSALALSLVGFNLGVETGQLILVALFIPLAYAARRLPMYQPVILRGGSVVVAVLAAGWLIDRSLNLGLMPF
jgi:hypothetical protein